MPNDVVVITGANNGIGLGLIRALADMNYRVAGLDLAVDHLSGLTAFECDVTDAIRVDEVVAEIADRWDRLDILVNNACLALFAPFDEKPVPEIRREFEVNYFGYINMIRAVFPYMKSRGRGIIHNVSSTVGLSGFAGIAGYASAKGAVEALTRTLALEFTPYGIAVNLIHPPLTRTRSSAPLGVPSAFMADPGKVGRKLAKKIRSTQAVVTPGFADTAGVVLTRLFPGMMGRFLSGRAEEARSKAR